MEKSFEHTDLRVAMLKSLDQLNRALLDLIEFTNYNEESLIDETKATRSTLDRVDSYLTMDFLIDRLTQTAIDYEVVYRKVK